MEATMGMTVAKTDNLGTFGVVIGMCADLVWVDWGSETEWLGVDELSVLVSGAEWLH
jgi:hypothetical protein